MNNLNTITRKYLRANGLTTAFFATWIGCEQSKAQKWLCGDRRITKDEERRVLLFLHGDHITPLDQIIAISDDPA